MARSCPSPGSRTATSSRARSTPVPASSIGTSPTGGSPDGRRTAPNIRRTVRKMTAIAGRAEDAGSTGRGILWLLLAVLLFVGMDTTAKYLCQTYPVPQVVWARYAFHVLFLIVVLGPRLPAAARTRRLGLQLVRSLMLLGTTGFFYAGVRWIPLVEASALMFLDRKSVG